MAPDECMFCHEGLDLDDGGPENLAFLDHVGANPGCQDGFDAWTHHMDRDFQG
jgi:hypothetical protein